MRCFKSICAQQAHVAHGSGPVYQFCAPCCAHFLPVLLGSWCTLFWPLAGMARKLDVLRLGENPPAIGLLSCFRMSSMPPCVNRQGCGKGSSNLALMTPRWCMCSHCPPLHGQWCGLCNGRPMSMKRHLLMHASNRGLVAARYAVSEGTMVPTWLVGESLLVYSPRCIYFSFAFHGTSPRLCHLS